MEHKVLLSFLLGLLIAGIPLAVQNYVLNMQFSEVRHEISLKDKDMSKPKAELEHILLNQSTIGYRRKVLWQNDRFPTYSFDEGTGTLRGWINFDVNDTLKVVYGSGLSLSGVGGGKDTMLYGVYGLPYQRYELIMLFVDIDGTACLSYRNVSMILKSGEEWVNITSRIDVQQFGNETSIANLTITDRIMNHGILHKSKIERGW